jgi:cellulose synthase/poly-beta-1,6-N-acetylglucosamine synthase-like glycosyltransferase
MGAIEVVSGALVASTFPTLVWGGYLGALGLLSFGSSGSATAGSAKTRFDVVVPAHDEEAGIDATVRSLLDVDYPAEMRRVLVVADNCADDTAGRAAAAGAIVLERTDPERRGKGYALEYAFARSLQDGFADAVVVVDADTTVTRNLLVAFDARLQHGARAVQAHYGVANPRASWRTRLMHIGFTLFHDVRSRARERLRVSAGLRGNGMAFAHTTLREVPHDAFSIVEDVEYGIRLGLAGHRVHYADEAKVFGQMVSSERASRSQRERWEGGRFALARKHAGRLFLRSLGVQSLLLFDLAMDLFVPPLTYVTLAAVVGMLASCAWWFLWHGAWWSTVPSLVALFGLAIYVVRGVWLSGVGWRAVPDLAWAPVYMVWKIALALSSRRSRGAARRGEWVRTTREGGGP